MKHYIRQKTDNSIQYTRHLIHKPRSIVLSKGHLTRNTFKSNIFMLINKLIVKFYVHGSLGVLQSWYLAYWWVSNCFFHELSYVKSLDFGPTFFVVIFNVICLTINNLSGILDTTDTSFVHPCISAPGARDESQRGAISAPRSRCNETLVTRGVMDWDRLTHWLT